jgi:nitrogen regulatory protein PII
MRILMIILNSKVREEMEILLKREGIEGYTEIPDVRGVGSTGVRMGSAVHPETSSVIMVLLEDEQLGELLKTIREYCSDCQQHIKMVHWPVDTVA